MRAGVFLAAIVLSFTGAASGRAARAQDLESAEPRPIEDQRALEAAIAKDESVARLTTSTDAAYAALCRGAAYSFKLADRGGPGCSDVAKHGYELADRARAIAPNRVEGHFLYAICLGVYLRENNLSGITRVSDLIAAAKRAVECDERYDRGGPHRVLALLYAEAPRFIGPGDHDLARKHAERLLEIAGDDDENKLAAAQVYIDIGDSKKARELLARVDPDRAPDPATRRARRLEQLRLQKLLDD
jgi:FimV-like protein